MSRRSTHRVVILRTPVRDLLRFAVPFVVVGAVMAWWLQFGPGVSWEPAIPGSRYSRQVGIWAGWLGAAFFASIVFGSALNGFALLVGDHRGVRFVSPYGLHRLRSRMTLAGDMTDARLTIHEAEPLKWMRRVRVTVSCPSGSISQILGEAVLTPGYQQRFEAWKRDWIAHHQDVPPGR